MSEDESWYQRITDENNLMQGDLIYHCPCIIVPKGSSAGSNINVDIIEYDAIVLTQSCDLGKPRIKLALVAPFWAMKEYEAIFPQFKDDNLKESAKRGYQPSLVILDKPEDDFLVVDFKSAYSVPVETLRDLIKTTPERLRLKPPYREHLSQEFAKFFMRVGLSKEIPHFSSHSIDYCDTCPIHHAVRE